MAKGSTNRMPEDLATWLRLAGALAALGVLPRNWRAKIGVAAAALWVLKQL